MSVTRESYDDTVDFVQQYDVTLKSHEIDRLCLRTLVMQLIKHRYRPKVDYISLNIPGATGAKVSAKVSC